MGERHNNRGGYNNGGGGGQQWGLVGIGSGEGVGMDPPL